MHILNGVQVPPQNGVYPIDRSLRGLKVTKMYMQNTEKNMRVQFIHDLVQKEKKDGEDTDSRPMREKDKKEVV